MCSPAGELPAQAFRKPVQSRHHRAIDRSVRRGSVRDQVLRATLLSRALFDFGILEVGSPLLVLGAGGCGVALALSASYHGANVVVVEYEHRPFTTIRKGVYRTVDPTEYDWPHEHWSNGTLPLAKRVAAVMARTVASTLEPALPLLRLSASDLVDAWTLAY